MATLPDPWLERWLPAIVEHAAGRPVLEIGCGEGDDTATLAGAGLPVIAFDLAEDAVRHTAQRVPAARVERRDLRGPWPADAAGLGVVVASLSLHYFPWHETLALAARLHGVLRPGGLLLVRLNSTEDLNFGARGHPEIEPGYHLVDGSPKRFFDEAAVRALFAEGWTIRSLEHRTTLKYLQPKALWEAVVERRG